MVGRFTPRQTQILRERPYVATRADFTRRGYASNAAVYEATRGSGVSAALDSVVSNAASRQLLRQDSLAYPGARGLVVVADPQIDVAGQRLGEGFSRLGYAWAYQAFDLFSDSVPHRARIVTLRDVRERIGALAPIFAQGTMVEPSFHVDTLYWKLELYSASSDLTSVLHLSL